MPVAESPLTLTSLNLRISSPSSLNLVVVSLRGFSVLSKDFNVSCQFFLCFFRAERLLFFNDMVREYVGVCVWIWCVGVCPPYPSLKTETRALPRSENLPAESLSQTTTDFTRPLPDQKTKNYDRAGSDKFRTPDPDLLCTSWARNTTLHHWSGTSAPPTKAAPPRTPNQKATFFCSLFFARAYTHTYSTRNTTYFCKFSDEFCTFTRFPNNFREQFRPFLENSELNGYNWYK